MKKTLTLHHVWEWMQGLDGLTITEEKGRFMVEYFNLPSLDKIPRSSRDSVEVVKALKEQGYEFKAITFVTQG